MTITIMSASWSRVAPDRAAQTGNYLAYSAADVQGLVDELASDQYADAAHLIRSRREVVTGLDEPGGSVEDHDVLVAVRDGWGYLNMWFEGETDDAVEQLAGDPTSPGFFSVTFEFPAGSGVPVAQLAEALTEFFQTGQRPKRFKWVAASY
jgi:Immunity protein Imm1